MCESLGLRKGVATRGKHSGFRARGNRAGSGTRARGFPFLDLAAEGEVEREVEGERPAVVIPGSGIRVQG